MSGAHFQKLCRDCGLVDRATDITEVDLVFCYVSGGACRRRKNLGSDDVSQGAGVLRRVLVIRTGHMCMF
jgi:hypothetical protein